MKNILGAIALEGAYQMLLARGARWSRRQFFRLGQRLVREHPEYLTETE